MSELEIIDIETGETTVETFRCPTSANLRWNELVLDYSKKVWVSGFIPTPNC